MEYRSENERIKIKEFNFLEEDIRAGKLTYVEANRRWNIIADIDIGDVILDHFSVQDAFKEVFGREIKIL